MKTLFDACEQYLSFNRRIRSPRTGGHYRLAVRQYCMAIQKPKPTIKDLSDDGLVKLEKFLLRLGHDVHPNDLACELVVTPCILRGLGVID